MDLVSKRRFCSEIQILDNFYLPGLKCLPYTPTPVVELRDGDLPVRILVKLEYKNHPFVSGNKWWKLKYNLEEAQLKNANTLLTFGGAYSNHIYATAAAASEIGLRSVGVIAGEEVTNPTLLFAMGRGMQLHFVSRTLYRTKDEQSFIQGLRERFGDFFLIPEGGTNEAAVRGCAEFGQMLKKDIKFDVVCLPVGTGGTTAGLISAMDETKTVLGFASLKGGSFLMNDVRMLVKEKVIRCQWDIETNYHFGGYAKRSKVLDDFMIQVRDEHDLELDHVYTAKMLFGVLDLARNGRFRKGSTILVIHTGGLQGRST